MVKTGITVLLAALAAFAQPATAAQGKPQRKTCKAADGVPIVYSVAGSGEPALVFVHGGLADRSFYDEQLKTLAPHHRVVALDLPGHGESGANRRKWGLPEFGDDVRAVVEAERLRSVVLFGNSLGGPVVIEAALRLPGRVLGVVGIDTFQYLTYTMGADDLRKRAEGFRDDYAGSLKQMVAALLHKDADPALVAEAERRMSKTPPQAAYQLFLSMAGYSPAEAARRMTAPLAAINGDLYPTDLVNVRSVHPEFQAIVMPHMGHYPMLERPAEFDAHVRTVVAAFLRHAKEGGPFSVPGAAEAPKARNEVRLTPAQLDRLVGRYELAPGFVLTISRQGEQLLSQATGQPSAEIFPESESEFFLKVVDAQLVFDLGQPGLAKGLRLRQGGREMPGKRIE